jgi:hypothetical protein
LVNSLAVSAAASLGLLAGIAPASALTPESVAPLAKSAPHSGHGHSHHHGGLGHGGSGGHGQATAVMDIEGHDH